MLAFFVTIGAAAGSITALLQTGWLAAFIALQLGVHMAITLGIGRLLNFPMEVRLWQLHVHEKTSLRCQLSCCNCIAGASKLAYCGTSKIAANCTSLSQVRPGCSLFCPCT